MDLQREKYKNSHPTVEMETYGPTICIGHIGEGAFNTDWEDRMRYAAQVDQGYSNFNLGKNAGRNGTGLIPEGEGY